MQKIGFIGAYDKIDCILYVAKILIELKKRILVIDATHKQKARYIVPSINPTIMYMTEFEGIDVAVGFKDFQTIEQYLGDRKIQNLYDYVFIDLDSPVMFQNFNLKEADKNYFVTSFDVYDLKKGLETLSFIQEPIKMTKVLFSRNMLQEEEQYLDYLARNYKIIWDDFKIYFPITVDDWNTIAENQRVEKIKLKKLSAAYKENLMYLCEGITKEFKSPDIRKTIKNIEKGA